MTLDDLRTECHAFGEAFLDLADRAERDEFAPWVVEALRIAAQNARAALAPEALEDARLIVERRER